MKKEVKFPEILRSLMNSKNLTMKELGELVGKSESSISYWLSGKVMPRISVIQKLADIFNITTDELIYGYKNDSLENYEENVEYLKDNYPNLVDLYNEIHANKQLVILFDKAKKLEPQDLTQILKIIDTFNKETKFYKRLSYFIYLYIDKNFSNAKILMRKKLVYEAYCST